VEGGSANDYDYVGGDPVNSDDLDGRQRGGKKNTSETQACRTCRMRK
jgi:hypothetical protein